MQSQEGIVPTIAGLDFSKDEVEKSLKTGVPLYANFGIVPPSIENQPRCNAHCYGCYASWGNYIVGEAKRNHKRLLNFKQWHKALKKVAPHVQTLVTSGEGEITMPSIWNDCQQLIDTALEKRLQVVMFTNGVSMDTTMAEWIASRIKLSVIGKWYHMDPKINNQLMGVRDYTYKIIDGVHVPAHIYYLIENGLTKNRRLAIGNTLTTRNIACVPDMWKFLRKHNIIPIFSWIVQTGMGKIVPNKQVISDSSRKKYTKKCWQIDKQMGIVWNTPNTVHYGPHIASKECKDQVMLYVDALGRTRRCPSSHCFAVGDIVHNTWGEIIQKWNTLLNDPQYSRARMLACGNTTCACALTAQ